MTYLDEVAQLIDAPLWFHKKGLSQTASGYGSKLTTPWKVEYRGRLYRIYCMCWSNSGTNYIISKGNRLIIREYTYPSVEK